jgi:hypothetical protein
MGAELSLREIQFEIGAGMTVRDALIQLDIHP